MEQQPKSKKRITTYIRTSTYNHIIHLAKRDDRSKSYIAGNILDDQFDNKLKPGDVAKLLDEVNKEVNEDD